MASLAPQCDRHSANGHLFPLIGADKTHPQLYGKPVSFNGFRFLFLLLLLSVGVWGQAHAQPANGVQVCPDRGETAPPAFDQPDCRTVGRLTEVDPQGASYWVRMRYDVALEDLPSGEPLGVFLFAKASSELWLNGVPLGRNGRPAADPAAEEIGRLDTVYYAPRGLVVDGDNRIDMRLSSHHGFMRLHSPIQQLYVASYARPARIILTGYWPTLLTFGVFLAGSIYFAAASFSTEHRRSTTLLAAASGSAGLQLFTEVARGGFNYAYPLHDVRLLAILVFSFVTGLLLLAYTLQRAGTAKANWIVLGAAVVTGAVLVPSRGFDLMSLLAVMIPLGIGLVAVMVALAPLPRRVWPKSPTFWLGLALALVLFVGLLAPTAFLNANFFFVFAAAFLLLFVIEAHTLGKERRARAAETERAGRLERALQVAEAAHQPRRLTLKDGASSVFVEPGEILACSGAGDYVDVRLTKARTLLHSGTLSELEEALPTNFLRVHRSHLVNLNHVQSLERTGSGTGLLHLGEGTPLPVSRRIMPKVRAEVHKS